MKVSHRLRSMMTLFAIVVLLGSLGLVSTSAMPIATARVNDQQDDGSARAKTATKASKPGKTDANGRAVYIVKLQDAPLATYTGGTAGIPATSPKATGERKLDTESQSAQSYRRYLAGEQTKVINTLERTLKRKVDVVFTYNAVLNGLALRLTPAEAEAVARLPKVVRVQRDELQQPQTDVGPRFIGAQTDAERHAATYKATINGAQENPPVTTNASGTGVFVYDASTRELSFQIKLMGINPGPAHIHRGVIGVNGPVAYPIEDDEVAPGQYIGSVTISEADEDLLYNGGLYVNFHTPAFPAGEIRGQVLPDWGEGMLVGILDSGINFAHPSFAAVGPVDGYQHVNPFGAGKYKGVCDSANTELFQAGFTCNDKLVGAWSYTDEEDISPLDEPSPADEDGHGSHTASTTAGNVVSSTLVLTTNVTIDTGLVSGVAPHANIIAYDVCLIDGCPNSSSIAAMDQAAEDGVDVVNFSIGGSSQDPWDNLEAESFLNATGAGVLISSSAGNSGPGVTTIGSPNNMPWVMSVAASTHNRKYPNSLVGLSGGSTPPPADLFGTGTTVGMAAPAPIVYAGNFLNEDGEANGQCTSDFAEGTDFTGKIVVCDWGSPGRVARAVRVQALGAIGFVLANTEADATTEMVDAYPIPAVHMDYNEGVTLKAWLASGTGHTGRIAGMSSTPDLNAQGDVLATFSSRGPDETALDILKPDISAPGLGILAAVANTNAALNEFDLYSGTSMAAPHNAGAAALVAALHPDWTPMEIASALMTTAVQRMVKEDGVTPATPFDRGSGRVDVGLAAQAGLVLNETAANFLAANPAEGGEPRNLNRPSMQDSRCVVSCTWTRTLRSTLGVTATWNVAATGGVSTTMTVQPSSFTVAPGGTQTITVTADVSQMELDTYAFGVVTLTAGDNLAPQAHLPVAVQSVVSNLTDYEYIETNASTSTTKISNVLAVPISDLSVQTYGLARGAQNTAMVSADSDNSAATDVLTDGVYLQTAVVPSDTVRFVTEVVTTTSEDVDIYVYLDGSEEQPLDGIPQDDELYAVCATGAALEYCNIQDPDPGNYIILVQNWQGVAAPARDMIKLSTAVVPAASSGNFTVSAPRTLAGRTPFDVTLNWNLPPLDKNDRYYGAFELGTSATTAGNLGYVEVDLVSTTNGARLYLPIASRTR